MNTVFSQITNAILNITIVIAIGAVIILVVDFVIRRVAR